MKNPIIFQKLASAALALLMTATMSACSEATYDQRIAGNNDSLNSAAPDFVIEAPVTTDPAASLPAQTPSPIGMEKAIEIVKTHLKDANAVITQRELDDDGVYELEVVSGGIEYDYDVDAFTGKILKAEKDDRDNNRSDSQTTVQTSSGYISAERAKQIAKEYLKNSSARVTDCELDDGKYDLEVISGGFEYEFEISATTGKILDVEKDELDD